MKRAFAILTVLVAPLVVATGAGACNDTVPPEPCSNIPAGGCPLSRGLACDDPSCLAAYACRSGGVWELDHTCPPRDASTSADAGARDGEPDAISIFDAAVDAPPGAWGGPGCGTLQAPDCALGLALACGANCCECEELFVCEEGAWTFWGTCSDAGVAAASKVAPR